MNLIRNKYFILFLSILTLAISWQVTAFWVGNEYLFPGLPDLAKALLILYSDKNFILIILTTLFRGMIGISFALLTAIIVAWGVWRNPLLNFYLRPVFSTIRSTPVISFILLFLIWFSNNQIPVLIGFLTMFPLLCENLIQGFKQINEKELEMGKAFHLRFANRFKYIIYPALKPSLFSGLISAAGFGWKAIIIGEALSQPEYGIGTAIKDAQSYIDVSGVIGWTIIAVIISYLIDLILIKVQQHNFPFKLNHGNLSLLQSNNIELISIRNVDKRFGKQEVLKKLNINFVPGSITCVTGPSGCGKTTLLRLLGRLILPDKGTVSISMPCRIGTVFQEPVLLNNLTVSENIALPLIGLYNEEKIRSLVCQSLALVDLSGSEESYPAQLSGGQQQRVSLARALAYPFDILLMDEPIKGFEKKLREDILKSIKDIHSKHGGTIIFVTHHEDEMRIADQAIHLSKL